MPSDDISIAVHTAERLIAVTLIGSPPAHAIVSMLEQVNVHAGADTSLRVLIDETQLRPSLISPADIAKFVATWRGCDAIRKTRMAIYVSNPAMFGLNRMFQGLARIEGGMAVFYDRIAALAWLAQSMTASP